MLKGKARLDFLEWYLEPEQKKTYKTISNKGGDKAIILNWYSLSESHRYGVIVDWFESVGICIEICKTRQKARQKAIEKAFEIYNENN